jgi:hypothetical protein
MSTCRGILSLIHNATTRIRPAANEKLTKLCTYLAACANSLKSSGPISGSSRIFPNVIFSPVRPRTTKETAVTQCEKRSKPLKRGIFIPERPLEIRIRPMIKYAIAKIAI